MASGKGSQRLYLETVSEDARAQMLSLVGDALALRALRALSDGPVRFSRLQLGASSKTLSAKLKALERCGLLTRTLYAQVPPKVEYALTPKGVELLSIVDGIAEWERSWRREGH